MACGGWSITNSLHLQVRFFQENIWILGWCIKSDFPWAENMVEILTFALYIPSKEHIHLFVFLMQRKYLFYEDY